MTYDTQPIEIELWALVTPAAAAADPNPWGAMFGGMFGGFMQRHESPAPVSLGKVTVPRARAEAGVSVLVAKAGRVERVTFNGKAYAYGPRSLVSVGTLVKVAMPQ